jgi:hypothetical protein
MVRSAPEFIIGPRFARTRWRVSNHEATEGAAMIRANSRSPEGLFVHRCTQCRRFIAGNRFDFAWRVFPLVAEISRYSDPFGQRFFGNTK